MPERAAHLEHRQAAGAEPAEIAEERREEVPPPRLLERQVQRRPPRALALDQHAHHPLAVGRDVLAAVHGEHAPIAQVHEVVVDLTHPPPVYSTVSPLDGDGEDHVADQRADVPVVAWRGRFQPFRGADNFSSGPVAGLGIDI